MPYPPRLGHALSLLPVLLSSTSACTLTAGDFEPALADQVSSCDDEACDGTSVEAAAAPGSDVNGAGESATPTEPTGPQPSLEIPASEVTNGTAPAPGTEPPALADAGAVDPDVTNPLPSTLTGWASLPGLGVGTTSGGGSGAPIVASDAEALRDLAARPEPLVIGILGVLELPLLELQSNKTLVGMDSSATLRGGIRIRGSADAFVTNVIVQNLNIDAVTSDAEGDGIQIHYAHHVWIDHCALRDAADGLIDIVHGSDFVTLSFNHLFYTAAAPAPDHRFANLIGHSVDNGAEDAGHLNVTLHHNLWGEGVTQAVFGRFGNIHVFDNHFVSPGNVSVLTAGLFSKLLVENNYFERVSAPHALFPNSSASLLAPGNVYVETSGAQTTTGSAFAPDYPYQLDPASALPEMLRAAAGPQ